MRGQGSMDEIYLLDYLSTIWKRKVLIILAVASAVLVTAIYSLSIKDVYQATAVISPISDKSDGEGISSLIQQFGGVGISLANSASSSEIVNLLKSNALKEKVVEKHKLLPVLFPDGVNTVKWKKTSTGGDPGNLPLYPQSAAILSTGRSGVGNKDGPTMWDALRKLDGIITVKNNSASNTITISADFHDPEIASTIVNYFLATLIEHMSEESKKVASSNARYLESKLNTTADPIIRQKIYNLLAQQIEVSMMADMNGNFAFKIIDPPRPPDTRIRPKRKQMVVLSLVISLFASLFLTLFVDHVKRL